MTGKDLKASLERSRAALRRLDDPGAREHAEQLIAEIESHVQGAGGAQQQSRLTARLEETIRRFEVEHPAFTAYLGEIMAALG
jgi:phytoene/squalene synthetase